MKQILFIAMVTLTFNSFGQETPFFDSLDFFVRTKTKQINVDQKMNGKLFRQTTCYFDKNKSSLTWCGKLVGGEVSCADTIYFKYGTRDTTYADGSKNKFYFDKYQRLTKATYTKIKSGQSPEITTMDYLYVDSLSKQLKLIIEDRPSSHTKITSYYYENSKLIKAHELFYGQGQNSSHQRARTHSFEYYPDMRLKTVTVSSPKENTIVSEFKYVDAKN